MILFSFKYEKIAANFQGNLVSNEKNGRSF